MPDYPLALLLLGVAAGILSGMFGIGGGVVIVPVLTLLFAFGQKEATGTSLAVLLFPVSFFAVLAYHRKKLLSIPVAALIATGLIVGALGGAQIALALPDTALKQLYGVFLIYVGWRFAEPRKVWAARQAESKTEKNNFTAESAESAEKNKVKAEKSKVKTESAEIQMAWYLMLGVGLIAGIASGLFGIGGGLVIVPILVGLLHYDQKRAVGTSLAALLPPVGLGAVLSYYDAGKIDIPTAGLIAIGLIFGAFAGAKIALGLPSSTIKRMYGVFLIVISFKFILGL